MNRLRAASLLVILLSATACQSRFVRTVAFWRQPDVQNPQIAIGVREAMLRQATFKHSAEADGAFDPRVSDPAVQTLEQKITATPQSAPMHLQLAEMYEKYSIEDMALDQYQRAFNLDPESLPALQGLARIMRKTPERLAEVLPKVRVFVEHHPDNVIALGTFASLLDDADQLAPAEALYRKALLLYGSGAGSGDGGGAYLHNNLGFNLLLQSRTADAIPEFRKALELNPQSQTARNNLGVALARRGNTKEALRVFTDAGVDAATAHNNLAVALLEQDRLEESRAELMESLAAHNFFQPALENFKLLLEMDQDRQSKAFTVPYRPALPLDWMRVLPNPPGENH